MKGRKIKGAVCLLICVSILSINIHEAKASSLGGVVALGDALATAGAGGTVGCLLAPEVIIPMVLVALGVAGVGYVANSSVVQDIAEDLSELPEGWTVLQGGGNDPNNRRPFLKGFYRAGKVFLSVALLKKIAEIAEGYGLFEGVKRTGTITYYNDIETGGKVKRYTSIEDVLDASVETINDSNWTKQKADELKGMLLLNNVDITKPGWIISKMNDPTNNGSIRLTITNIDELTISSIYDRGSYLKQVFFNEGAVSCYNVNYNYNYGIFNASTGNQTSIYHGFGAYNGNFYISSFGALYDAAISGIPVTGNIPSYDVEDGWRLPEWKYNGINIDPVADPEGATEANPVSLPDGAEIPLIYPIGDEPTVWPEINPEPYRWPDNLPSDPSDPDPAAQDEAQRGAVDVIPGIDEDPTISNETIFNSLTVPKSIREKFPFCLIYDVYDIYNITFYGVNPDSAKMGFNSDNAEFAVISSGSTSENIINVGAGRSIERKAPRFEWIPPNIPGFQNMEPIIIDLSMFDEYALKFRFCIYIIYSISIAMGLVNAYKGTFGSASEDHGPAV